MASRWQACPSGIEPLSGSCGAGLAAQHLHEFPALQQPLKVIRSSHEHSFDEHHREGGPPGPHLQGVAASPAGEVAPVLEIPVDNAGPLKQLACLFRKRILCHSDNHDVVGGYCALYLAYDVCIVAADDPADRGVDVGFVEDV